MLIRSLCTDGTCPTISRLPMHEGDCLVPHVGRRCKIGRNHPLWVLIVSHKFHTNSRRSFDCVILLSYHFYLTNSVVVSHPLEYLSLWPSYSMCCDIPFRRHHYIIFRVTRAFVRCWVSCSRGISRRISRALEDKFQLIVADSAALYMWSWCSLVAQRLRRATHLLYIAISAARIGRIVWRRADNENFEWG